MKRKLTNRQIREIASQMAKRSINEGIATDAAKELANHAGREIKRYFQKGKDAMSDFLSDADDAPMNGTEKDQKRFEKNKATRKANRQAKNAQRKNDNETKLRRNLTKIGGCLSESNMNALIKRTIKQVLRETVENGGRCPGAEDEFEVSMWNLSTRTLDPIVVCADDEDDAIYQAVAQLDQDENYEYFMDDIIESARTNMEQEGWSEEEIDNELNGDDSVAYIDATPYGAKEPHYIRIDNLRVAQR